MPAEPRLACINRQQFVLRSIDVERLIDEDHSARPIWQLIGRLDLSLYHGQIKAVEGCAGREHTDPQLLISMWIYAYSRGVSSASPKKACPNCPLRVQVRTAIGASRLAALNHAPRRTSGNDRIQAEDGNGGSETNLRATLADRRVPACLDKRTLQPASVSLPRSPESNDGSDLGLPKLQPVEMVSPKADTAITASVVRENCADE